MPGWDFFNTKIMAWHLPISIHLNIFRHLLYSNFFLFNLLIHNGHEPVVHGCLSTTLLWKFRLCALSVICCLATRGTFLFLSDNMLIYNVPLIIEMSFTNYRPDKNQIFILTPNSDAQILHFYWFLRKKCPVTSTFCIWNQWFSQKICYASVIYKMKHFRNWWVGKSYQSKF